MEAVSLLAGLWSPLCGNTEYWSWRGPEGSFGPIISFYGRCAEIQSGPWFEQSHTADVRQPLNTALLTPSSLSHNTHCPLLESCQPSSLRSSGVRPHLSLSRQHLYRAGESGFIEAGKCLRCSLPQQQSRWRRNSLWFCWELLCNIRVPPWDSVSSPVTWGYWAWWPWGLTRYDYLRLV